MARRLRIRPGRRRSPLAILVALLAILAVWLARDGARWRTEPPREGQWRTVERVIDGDTLELDGGERVRLLGVDTPESVHPQRPVEHFGREAGEFTRRLAEGRTVRLEFDQERTDRYGRTLAYVYLDDNTFLNAEIIRRGYGFAYTRFPFRYLEEFRALEREARQQRRGLWAQAP